LKQLELTQGSKADRFSAKSHAVVAMIVVAMILNCREILQLQPILR